MNTNRDFTSLDTFYIVQELQQLSGAFVKKIYQKGQNLYLILHKEKNYTLVIGPNRLHLTNYEIEFPKNPPDFTMLLRKHLANSKLTTVEQVGFDRVVLFQFSNQKKLIAEVFSKGNIILLDSESTIIRPLHFQEWAARSVKPKRPYVQPPGGLNPKTITEKQLADGLKQADNQIVKILAMDFGFGGFYAEEICQLACVTKNKNATELTAREISAIYKKIKSVFKEKPRTNSEFWDEQFAESDLKKAEKEEGKTKEKLKKLLEKQEQKLKETISNIGEFKKKADQLSIEQKFKEAEELYKKSKKEKEKILGLKLAIAQTKTKIEKETVKIKEIEKPEKKIEKKKEWFDKFRHFKTSANALVVCGKDATTNEILIKKHAEPDETVFHAELPGAPFCVIKSETPTKTDLEETATFSASYSKAWQRGLGTADVYAVKTTQVKKEFSLPKGSFMIHGKKKYFRNTELRLAIGFDKSFEVISGPENSIKKKAVKYSMVAPGSIKSKELAQKIKIIWLKDISKEQAEKVKQIKPEDIQKYIPTGKGSLVK